MGSTWRSQSALLVRINWTSEKGIEVDIPIHRLIFHDISPSLSFRPSSIPRHGETKYAVLDIVSVA